MNYITCFFNKETYICCCRDDEKRIKHPKKNKSLHKHFNNLRNKRSPKPYRRENPYIERTSNKNLKKIIIKSNDSAILYGGEVSPSQ